MADNTYITRQNKVQDNFNTGEGRVIHKYL